MNVKKGDLAIIVGAEITIEMIGMIVEVIRPAVNGEIIEGFQIELDSPTWVVRSVGGAKIPLRDVDDYELFYVTERPVCDQYLRPVSGLPVEEYDRIMEKEPA